MRLAALVIPVLPLASPWTNMAGVSNWPTTRDEAGSYYHQNQLCLFGGRGELPVDCLDIETSTWHSSQTTTSDVSHVQPIVWRDEVWVVTGLTGQWPGWWNEQHPEERERSIDKVYVYNPASDALRSTCTIPVEFRRASAGVVNFMDLFYIVQGATHGHLRKFGARAFEGFTRFNPTDCSWSALPATPAFKRDHFQAALIGSTIVLAGGRDTAHDDDDTKTTHYTVPPTAL